MEVSKVSTAVSEEIDLGGELEQLDETTAAAVGANGSVAAAGDGTSAGMAVDGSSSEEEDETLAVRFFVDLTKTHGRIDCRSLHAEHLQLMKEHQLPASPDQTERKRSPVPAPPNPFLAASATTGAATSASSNRPTPKRKKARDSDESESSSDEEESAAAPARSHERYDLEDDFIDDSELADDEPETRIKFQAHGGQNVPTVSGAPLALEKDKPKKKRRKPTVEQSFSAEIEAQLAALKKTVDDSKIATLKDEKPTLKIPKECDAELRALERLTVTTVEESARKHVYTRIASILPFGVNSIKKKMRALYSKEQEDENKLKLKELLEVTIKAKVDADVDAFRVLEKDRKEGKQITINRDEKGAIVSMKYRCRLEQFASELSTALDIQTAVVNAMNSAKQKDQQIPIEDARLELCKKIAGVWPDGLVKHSQIITKYKAMAAAKQKQREKEKAALIAAAPPTTSTTPAATATATPKASADGDASSGAESEADADAQLPAAAPAATASASATASKLAAAVNVSDDDDDFASAPKKAKPASDATTKAAPAAPAVTSAPASIPAVVTAAPAPAQKSAALAAALAAARATRDSKSKPKSKSAKAAAADTAADSTPVPAVAAAAAVASGGKSKPAKPTASATPTSLSQQQLQPSEASAATTSKSKSKSKAKSKSAAPDEPASAASPKKTTKTNNSTTDAALALPRMGSSFASLPPGTGTVWSHQFFPTE